MDDGGRGDTSHIFARSTPAQDDEGITVAMEGDSDDEWEAYDPVQWQRVTAPPEDAHSPQPIASPGGIGSAVAPACLT